MHHLVAKTHGGEHFPKLCDLAGAVAQFFLNLAAHAGLRHLARFQTPGGDFPHHAAARRTKLADQQHPAILQQRQDRRAAGMAHHFKNGTPPVGQFVFLAIQGNNAAFKDFFDHARHTTDPWVSVG